MNNVSGWKKTRKNFRLDRESNPHLCDDRTKRSIHQANQAEQTIMSNCLRIWLLFKQRNDEDCYEYSEETKRQFSY